MRNYDAYMADGGRRAFREALLFQLINDADYRYTPDGVPRGPGGEEVPNRVHLTLEQKRRLRNEIYRIGKGVIDAHNDALPDGAPESERWNELGESQKRGGLGHGSAEGAAHYARVSLRPPICVL